MTRDNTSKIPVDKEPKPDSTASIVLIKSRLHRRHFLKTTAGFGLLPLANTVKGQTTPASEGGDETWSFETCAETSPPTVVDGVVYVGCYNGRVYAVNANEGTEQWEFETGGHVSAAPTVVDNTVFVSSYDNNVYAIDTEEGAEYWRFEASGEVGTSPIVVDNTVYIMGQYSNEDYHCRVYAVNASDGTEQWQAEIAGRGRFSPLVVDETVFVVPGGHGSVFALDRTDGDVINREDGQVISMTPSNAPHSSAPTIADGTLYVGNNDNNIYALDTARESISSESDDDVIWNFPVELPSTPTVDDGQVFVGSTDDNLYAVNASNGAKSWEFHTGSSVSSPTVAGDVLFVTSDNILYALDTANGEERWRFEAQDSLTYPIVVNGTVYVGSYGQQIYAVDAGIDESSDDSRIMFGTHGHHGGWRYAGQSIDIDTNANSSTTQEFHPGEHGFGFDNWSGTKSWSVDGQDLQYDPADVSEENVRQLVAEVWPSEHGEALLEPVVKYVYTQFNQGTLTNGHCYGMIHAAIEYFEDPSALPEAADSASDVPYPVGQYEAVGDDIRYYHQSQFFDSASSSSVLQELDDFKSGLFSILLPGFADVDLTAEIEELRDAIDEYGFAPINLSDPGNDDYHQVLGYDYEVAEDETTVFTYDPNESEGYYVDESVEFYRLEVDENGSPTMEYYFNDNLEPYSQFVSMSDVQRNADLREVAAGAVITALIGAAESAKTYLQAAAQVGKQKIRLMFAGLHSPAHLEVTGPDEATIIHPDRSEINETMDYTDVVFIFDAPTGDYSYEVVGEGDGEYTLEMIGASQDEVLVSEEVESEITEGERHNVNVMIPETGDAEISLDKEGNSSESGLVDIETVAGGGAVTVGLLYLAYRMKQDETEPK